MNVRTNRFSLELKLGRPIASGMKALHTCDNPSCCSLEHLYEGTVQQNVDDRMSHGRGNPPRKLPNTDVVTLRERAAKGERFSSIALDLGVTPAHVADIAHGKVRLDAGGPIVPRRDAAERRRLGILNHTPNAKRPGTGLGGERNPRAKLTAATVATIRERAAAGESLTSLGRAFDVTTTSVWAAVHGLTWPNAGGPILPRE